MTRTQILCAVAAIAIGWVASSAEAETFVVSPSGGDDTGAIQEAFDAALAAGPGNRVQLTAGDFRTGFIEVSGFKGEFMGAGTTQTVVRPVPDLPCSEQVADNSLPALFRFRGGDIQIADLTIAVEELDPCELWEHPTVPTPRQDLAAILMLTGAPVDEFFDCSNPTLEVVNSTIDHVAFRGHPDWLALSSGVHNIIRIQPEINWIPGPCEGSFNPLSGSHRVSHSSFEHAQVGLDAGLTDGVLQFGSPGGGNTIDNVEAGLVAIDNSNSSIAFRHNRVTRARVSGIGILQGLRRFDLPSDFVVAHNSIEAVDMADGVAIYDYIALLAGVKSANVLVSNNTISLDTPWGGVFGFGAQDVLISNNRIGGTGIAGIYMGLYSDPSSGWTLKGNNLNGLNAGIAPVVFGPDTSHCLLVGGHSAHTALDLGSDNILVGVNNQGQPPGPELQEAMEQKRELLDSIKH